MKNPKVGTRFIRVWHDASLVVYRVVKVTKKMELQVRHIRSKGGTILIAEEDRKLSGDHYVSLDLTDHRMLPYHPHTHRRLLEINKQFVVDRADTEEKAMYRHKRAAKEAHENMEYGRKLAAVIQQKIDELAPKKKLTR